MTELLYQPRPLGVGANFSVFPNARVFTWSAGSVAEIIGHSGKVLIPVLPEPIYFSRIVNALIAMGCDPIVVSPNLDGLTAIFGVILRPSMRPAGAKVALSSPEL